jgi:hypothetical protein
MGHEKRSAVHKTREAKAGHMNAEKVFGHETDFVIKF